MTNNIIHWVKPLTSLKLTVFCLGCAMILVFLGTLDQVNIGVYEAENRYFKSFFLYSTPPGTTLKLPWFPSGYLVGGVLLVNLIAAPGTIQIHLEKSGHPRPALWSDPVTARPIVHQSVPSGKSDAP
jgi:hypothetical protein